MDTMLEQVGTLMARVQPVGKALDRVVSYIAPQRAAAACSGFVCARSCVISGWWCQLRGYSYKTVETLSPGANCSGGYCYKEYCGC